MSERNRSLISATAVMAAGTAISRVLGFIRVAVLAAILGNVGAQADGYNLAFAVSNGLYFLIAGGVLNTVLVPQIVRAIKNDADGGSAFVSRIATAILAGLAVVTVLLTAATPLVMLPYTNADWLAPGMTAQWQSVLLMAYLLMPQIFFYGLYVVLGQVLNAHGRFGPMMWAPIVNNVVSIGVLIGYWAIWGVTAPTERGEAFTTAQALTLGIGGLLGIVAQAVVMIPYIRATGLRLRPRWDLRGTGLGPIFRLSAWTLVYMTVSQIGVMITTNIASGAAPGDGSGLTAYTNSRLVWQVPHSMITVSLATAMLPMVARLAQDRDLAGAAAEGLRTQRLAATVIVPATIAFAALAFPLSRVLFGSGAGALDYGFVAWTLIAACVGIIPFTVQYICLRLYYALEDTRTPALQQVVIVAINITLALILTSLPGVSPLWLAPALAISYALSYVIGVFISWHNLHKRLPGLDPAVVVRHLVRVALCAIPAGLVAFGISWFTRGWYDSLLLTVLVLALGGLVGLAVFVAMAKVFQIREVDDIISTVLRRRGGRGKDEPVDPSVSVPVEEYLGDDEPTEIFHFPEQTMNDPQTVLMPRIGQEVPPVPDHRALQPEQPIDPGSFGVPDMPQRSAGDLEDTTEEEHPIRVRPGQELGHRYRLERLIIRRESSQSWQAWDSVLSRQVMMHLLIAGSPQTESVLYASRSAAVATDSRFLRVLDVVPSTTVTDPPDAVEDPEAWPPMAAPAPEPVRLAYVVTEWAEGSTLQDVLQSGPLTAVESAWLIRELADALAGIHDQHLGHERLNPETVIITPTGNVKIAGLLTEIALQPDDPHTDPSAEELIYNLRDVHDLGRLLYACLLCRWPGGPAYGLGEAPTSGRHWLTPRQVRAGVSPVLDELTDRLLNPVPRHRKPPIHDAAELAAELTRVLAGTDAVADLERRVRQQRSPGQSQADTRLPLARGIGPTVPIPAPTPASSPSPAISPQVRVRSRADETVTRMAPVDRRGDDRPDAAAAVAPSDRERPSRAALIVPAVLALVFVLVIAIARIAGGNLSAESTNPPVSSEQPAEPSDEQSAEEEPAPPAEPQPREIVDARDFDPQGDDQTENPDLVPNAIDGDPETAWRTMQYFNNPALGGAKRGVGLVIDLGEEVPISQVDVLLGEGGTDVELRVPTEPAGDEPPMDSDEQWRIVASVEGASGQTELEVDPAQESRFVLIYLTRLAPDGGNFRGYIYEVDVTG